MPESDRCQLTYTSRLMWPPDFLLDVFQVACHLSVTGTCLDHLTKGCYVGTKGRAVSDDVLLKIGSELAA